MAFLNPDMKDMLDVFQTESMELMDRMETCLMSAEKTRQLPARVLQEIFRIVHTMKSSSAMMGMETMSRCTHRLEDLFLIYRDAPDKTAGVGAQIFDLLYGYVDYVRGEMERILDPDYEPAKTDRLMEAVGRELERVQKAEREKVPDEEVLAPGQTVEPADGEEILASGQTPETSGAAGQPGPEKSAGQERECRWRIHLQDDCQMENVRAFLVLKQITPLCSTISSMPSELQAAGAAEQIRKDGLLVCFMAKEPEQVYQKLVASIYVKAIEDLSDAQEPADGRTADDRTADDRTADGRIADDRTTGGRTADGKTTGGETADGEIVADKMRVGKTADGKSVLKTVAAEAAAGEAVPEKAESGKMILARPAAKDEKKKTAGDGSPAASKTGTVSWQKILLLQNVTGELITLNNMLEREAAGAKVSGKLEELILNNRHLLHELEHVVNEVSMMPISGMVHQYNRAIRDICKKEGKEITFQVQGEELEVDKTLIDSLTSPLLHLIRNAADHGIESQEERKQAGKSGVGKILFSVFSTGENLYFSVSDDGRGLSREQILDKAEKLGMLAQPREEYTEEAAYQLIFRAGFSTSAKVTEFSGRGVGLDVVQKAAEQLRGSVYVESQPGEGTTITVCVPVSLTSVDSIQFLLGPHTCFVPTRNVEQICSYQQSKERISRMNGKEYFREQGLIPLLRLRTAYGLPPQSEEEQDMSFIIVVKGVRHEMAFVADQIIGQSTIVEKAMPALIPRVYKKQTGINGCAVTADGSIGFILNADWIMRAYERGDFYGEAASHHA